MSAKEFEDAYFVSSKQLESPFPTTPATTASRRSKQERGNHGPKKPQAKDKLDDGAGIDPQWSGTFDDFCFDGNITAALRDAVGEDRSRELFTICLDEIDLSAV